MKNSSSGSLLRSNSWIMSVDSAYSASGLELISIADGELTGNGDCPAFTGVRILEFGESISPLSWFISFWALMAISASSMKSFSWSLFDLYS